MHQSDGKKATNNYRLLPTMPIFYLLYLILFYYDVDHQQGVSQHITRYRNQAIEKRHVFFFSFAKRLNRFTDKFVCMSRTSQSNNCFCFQIRERIAFIINRSGYCICTYHTSCISILHIKTGLQQMHRLVQFMQLGE